VLCIIVFWYILLIFQALSIFVLNIFLLLLTYIYFFSKSLSRDQIGSCSKRNYRWTSRSLANLARCRRDREKKEEDCRRCQDIMRRKHRRRSFLSSTFVFLKMICLTNFMLKIFKHDMLCDVDEGVDIEIEIILCDIYKPL